MGYHVKVEFPPFGELPDRCPAAGPGLAAQLMGVQIAALNPDSNSALSTLKGSDLDAVLRASCVVARLVSESTGSIETALYAGETVLTNAESLLSPEATNG